MNLVEDLDHVQSIPKSGLGIGAHAGAAHVGMRPSVRTRMVVAQVGVLPRLVRPMHVDACAWPRCAVYAWSMALVRSKKASRDPWDLSLVFVMVHGYFARSDGPVQWLSMIR